MSLINKMLRDLDARGGEGARGDASSLVRPVGRAARSPVSPLVIGAGVAVLAIIGASGFVAWKYLRSQQVASAPAVAVVRAPQANPTQPVVQKNGPVAVVAGDEGPAVVPGNIPPEEHRAAGEKMAREMEERNAAARLAAAGDAATAGRSTEAVPDASQRAGRGRSASATESASPTGTAGQGSLQDPNAVATRGLKTEMATAKDKSSRGITSGVAATRSAQGRATAGGRGTSRAVAGQMAVAGAGMAGAGVTSSPATGNAATVEASLSPQQKAENEYRRALVKLQDARVSEALAGLERALELYPRHDAARQTLVSLLIEGGRNAEAIHHLALATSLDPRQANMAMLLARLQLEYGGNALETLQRSLPYAESNAEYRAVMAGILQRANRHKEAIEHYQAAVQLQPANAVWWMGLGISQQAYKRNADAKAAFQRAAESGRLTPDLQSFVERRLQQLN